MARQKGKRPSASEPSSLIASIERYEQTYFISEHGLSGKATNDEALIEIQGRIVRISAEHKQHVAQPIEITFACAATYAAGERTPVSDQPFLLPMNLGKHQRSFMAYLPAAAFWSIPAMIEAGRLTHIEARFNRPRYGSGKLLGVYLMPESKFRAEQL